ncbi:MULTISPECIES: DNA-directed RNA polymerase subunit alpha C-terminal domain-containing protein [Pseudomonas]|uniref:RNA polymerase, alpha chain C terminal domain n=1 Tax=Pseudomonas lutea TaxID=243924 RepID=A0A9X8MH71_9PSED|nr:MULTISPECIES: DNA-directed RNA polymerase subunit alpha C-terminal domain-containing protein [Pseudomonas]SER37790.1 RNA polymerase, alpha chain C terminal domain [Pseudomonas lutea]
MTKEDATRAEAIQWCKDNKCDFVKPVFPPPSGWMWGEGNNGICLTAIFTLTGDCRDITREDVEVGIEPTAWQAGFIGQDWSTCSKEHHDMVKQNPAEWPEYQVRALYSESDVEVLKAELDQYRANAERYRGVRRIANTQGYSDADFDAQTDQRIAAFEANNQGGSIISHDLPVMELPLPEKLRNLLCANQIMSLRHLLEHSVIDLLKIPDFGKKSLALVEKLAAPYGGLAKESIRFKEAARYERKVCNVSSCNDPVYNEQLGCCKRHYESVKRLRYGAREEGQPV